ncbi:MAG: D-tagatose-bisphosphate aldolase, class II, non-catalytic subunit [Pseudomonadota bacterium]
MPAALDDLATARRDQRPVGITSVCSAHPLVIRAALRLARKSGETALIEATCNQVNHRGGYTGLQPADFVALVMRIAGEEGCSKNRIVLGGDHLGPNPWRDRAAREAMAEAREMVAAYIRAGFRKIHLDASMPCADDPPTLVDAVIAERAADLARVAEETAQTAGGEMPRYIIGTEVPPPGGANHSLDTVPPTDPGSARQTIDIHRQTFARAGLDDAFARVLAVVVQPGVEFGNRDVVRYDRVAAQPLADVLGDYPTLVFEAHSTDYQGRAPLTELVADGFAILKVGPELTFALREALYGLDIIASDMLPDYGDRPLFHAMERTMLADPANWERHYHGPASELRVLRHYGLTDRIRYYWPVPDAVRAVRRLTDALEGQCIPLPLMWQHLPAAVEFAEQPLDAEALVIWRISQSLKSYHDACHPAASN